MTAKQRLLPRGVNVRDHPARLAGFEPFLTGRFWAFPEGRSSELTAELHSSQQGELFRDRRLLDWALQQQGVDLPHEVADQKESAASDR
jgi:hypothetical protein